MDILLIFLVQAALIGVIGGAIGIVTDIGISFILPVLLSGSGPGSSGGPSRSTTSGGKGGGGGFGGGFQSISFTPVVTPEVVVIAFTVATIVSVMAGIYPAWRA